MRQVADFHIHSQYSRACSGALTLTNIDSACRTKGIDIIGTGDFTHPVWFKNIKKELEEINNTGLFKLKQANNNQVKFILTTELSLVYKKNNKTRRLHIVLHAPNLKAVTQLNTYLDKHYNIRSDGRPILGMRAEKLMELLFSINDNFLIYPAHIWTPWYAVFGSKSGFDSLEECFDIWTPYIYAYETGLSSDPEMNWRLSALDNLTMLSNSDAHSLPNLAREANVFNLKKITYQEIYQVIKNKYNRRTLSSDEQNQKSFLDYTIEFYPEEGMYHLDGHRHCHIRLTPEESKKYNNICPKCHRPLTIGVMSRIAELADRPLGYQPNNRADFVKLVELDKIIAESLNIKSRNSKKVQTIYQNMIKNLGPELTILEKIPLNNIRAKAGELIAQGIDRVRQGRLNIQAGFDGQYGTVKIFTPDELAQQKKLL